MALSLYISKLVWTAAQDLPVLSKQVSIAELKTRPLERAVLCGYTRAWVKAHLIHCWDWRQLQRVNNCIMIA